MIQAIERLRHAKTRLDATDGDVRERLRDAAFAFLVAAIDREVWPPSFRIDSERVRARLLRLGVVEGDLSDVDDAAVAQATSDLRSLCAKVEQIASDGRSAADHSHSICLPSSRSAMPNG